MPVSAPRNRRLVGGALLALALAATAACGGSALSPREVLAANQAVLGETGGSNTGTTGTTTGTTGTTTGTTGTTTGTTGSNLGTNTGTTGTTTGTTGTTTGTTGTTTGQGGTPQANTPAGSCAGFHNQLGITNTTITIGNSADVSGPVPGLFTAAQQAARAYVTYFNATHPTGICGRKLVLNTYDSRTDAGADQQATEAMCASSFAGVGSLGVFDSGGAQTAQNCGLPDIRATATTAARNECSTCFSAQGTGPHEYSNGIADFFVQNYHAASQKAAFLYLNAGASAENAMTQIAVDTKRGMKFLYTSPIDVAAFNYGPYVQAMQSKGVQWVQLVGGYQQDVRLAQAMQSAGFKPQVVHFDQTADDPGFLASGGSAVEGVFVSLTYNPLFQSAPELNLYKQWLQQSNPGASPNAYGMYGWSAAKLFVTEALALGGKLTRASLVHALLGVHAWTGGGLHAPMDVGGKHTTTCVRFQRVQNGRFVVTGPNRFICDGYSTA
jgi:hypothetical protein